jgi:hypothetical protein
MSEGISGRQVADGVVSVVICALGAWTATTGYPFAGALQWLIGAVVFVRSRAQRLRTGSDQQEAQSDE